MGDAIKVGMADLKVTSKPNSLTTLGLGSCVGICLYDKSKKIIGMAHIMLPSSKEIRNNSNKYKFADTAIDEMIKLMKEKGATKRRLTAKIAGGAMMFKFKSNSSKMNVGQRNAEAVKQILKEKRIKILADDTGGSFGRTITFDSSDGSLKIKTIGHGTEIV